MTCGVYEIKNLETNQSYIGRSINIETRFNGHLSHPSKNMIPTIELYNENPKMVELNIIREIDEYDFDKEELKFITSVCELYEINQRGGWESEQLINGRDGEILACPPTIIAKREFLPDCVTAEDLFAGIEKWANDVYRYRVNHNPNSFVNKSKRTDADSGMYWRRAYLDIKDKYEELLEKNKYSSPVIQEQKSYPIDYSKKMKKDYEHFKLKKANILLKEKVEELESKLSFWKEKSVSWRDKHLNLLENQISLTYETLVVKKISEYSNRQRIDINKSDGFLEGQEVIIVSKEEFNESI